MIRDRLARISHREADSAKALITDYLVRLQYEFNCWVEGLFFPSTAEIPLTSVGEAVPGFPKLVEEIGNSSISDYQQGKVGVAFRAELWKGPEGDLVARLYTTTPKPNECRVVSWINSLYKG